jgi:gamma-D-glutamyl-L-lysine dipeptidyl-peptidase
LDVSAHSGPDGWRLTGSASHPIHRTAVGELLKAVGCKPLVNEVELLPSSGLGDSRFGVVQIPMALTFSKPGMDGGLATQLLLGERVWLLDVSHDGEYLLHQAADGYIGWVRREAIRRMKEDEFRSWQTARRATLMNEYLADGFRIPTGATLPILQEGAEQVRLRLPVAIKSAQHGDQIEIPAQFLRIPPAVDVGLKAAQIASQFLTTPYVFGGRSGGQGLDCSGLGGLAYQALGIRLPRDARQQVLVGELVATHWHHELLRPGDLLFFLDSAGRVSHEAVSLGGGRYVHASPPDVHVNSIDPDDELFHPEFFRRFAFARRIVE